MVKARAVAAFLLVLLGVYSAYRGIASFTRSDRERIQLLFDELTEAFASGNRRAVLSYLSDDVLVEYRRETLSRSEIGQHLAFRFVRGERIVLDGGITELKIDRAEKRAEVLWSGRVWLRDVRSGRRVGRLWRGTARIEFQKRGGEWLIVRVKAQSAGQ